VSAREEELETNLLSLTPIPSDLTPTHSPKQSTKGGRLLPHSLLPLPRMRLALFLFLFLAFLPFLGPAFLPSLPRWLPGMAALSMTKWLKKWKKRKREKMTDKEKEEETEEGREEGQTSNMLPEW